MSHSVAERACAITVVLVLLVATVFPGSASTGSCKACAPGCPMHARKIGCHVTSQISCHRAAPAPGIRTACTHPHDPFTGGPAPLRGVVPLRFRLPAFLHPTGVEPPSLALVSRPLPEPPTGPPRSSVA